MWSLCGPIGPRLGPDGGRAIVCEGVTDEERPRTEIDFNPRGRGGESSAHVPVASASAPALAGEDQTFHSALSRRMAFSHSVSVAGFSVLMWTTLW